MSTTAVTNNEAIINKFGNNIDATKIESQRKTQNQFQAKQQHQPF